MRLCQQHWCPMTVDGPSLADDEATFRVYSEALADAFEQIAESWFQSLVERRAPGMSTGDGRAEQLRAAAGDTAAELRALLAVDITAQQVGPLEILRRAVTDVPTRILHGLGVAAVTRDDFAISNFPDDVFGLTPASFADVDPSLHEPGLVWGAAKAHIHLRRRREES